MTVIAALPPALWSIWTVTEPIAGGAIEMVNLVAPFCRGSTPIRAPAACVAGFCPVVPAAVRVWMSEAMARAAEADGVASAGCCGA